MGKHEKPKCRCPLGGRILTYIICISMLMNCFYYYSPAVSAVEPVPEVKVLTVEDTAEVEPIEEIDILEVELIVEPEPEPVIEEVIKEPAPMMTHDYGGKGLTKRGGVYWNPYTGLKETWYSQRVLPGGGLTIPGRHVNDEGFVCDGDGYICVSSSTYPKGTVIETSRGMGKVYDSGCAPGILDIYTNW